MEGRSNIPNNNTGWKSGVKPSITGNVEGGRPRSIIRAPIPSSLTSEFPVQKKALETVDSETAKKLQKSPEVVGPLSKNDSPPPLTTPSSMEINTLKHQGEVLHTEKAKSLSVAEDIAQQLHSPEKMDKQTLTNALSRFFLAAQQDTSTNLSKLQLYITVSLDGSKDPLEYLQQALPKILQTQTPWPPLVKEGLQLILDALTTKDAPPSPKTSPDDTLTFTGRLGELTSEVYIGHLTSNTQHGAKSATLRPALNKQHSVFGSLRIKTGQMKEQISGKGKDLKSTFNTEIIKPLESARKAGTIKDMISQLETVALRVKKFVEADEKSSGIFKAKQTHARDIQNRLKIDDLITDLRGLDARLKKAENTLIQGDLPSLEDIRLLQQLAEKSEFPAFTHDAARIIEAMNQSPALMDTIAAIPGNINPENITPKDIHALKMLQVFSHMNSAPELQQTAQQALLAIRNTHHIIVGENMQLFKMKNPENPLKSGGFGGIYDARNLETGETLVIKKIVQGDGSDAVDASTAEHELFTKFPSLREGKYISPNIDHVLMQNGNVKELFIAMPKLHSELKDKLDELPPPSVDIFQEKTPDYTVAAKDEFQKQFGKMIMTMLRGIKELHDKGAAHTDLQENNFMLDIHDLIRLIDFGTACYGGRIDEELGRVIQDIDRTDVVVRRNDFRISPEMIAVKERQLAIGRYNELKIMDKLGLSNEELATVTIQEIEESGKLTPEELQVLQNMGERLNAVFKGLIRDRAELEEKAKFPSEYSLKKLDIWDLGVMLFKIVDEKLNPAGKGRLPYETSHFVDQPEKIIRNTDKIKAMENDVSGNYPENSLMNLIAKMLIKNPAQRPTVDQLLAHPFLQNI